MSVRHIRNGMIGFCVFLLAVITGITAYRAGKPEEGVMPQIEQTATAEEADVKKETAEYFTARLEGEVLSVYAGYDEREEFLYTLDVRVEDISEDEERWLREGVVLHSRQELASFEEDFTS